LVRVEEPTPVVARGAIPVAPPTALDTILPVGADCSLAHFPKSKVSLHTAEILAVVEVISAIALSPDCRDGHSTRGDDAIIVVPGTAVLAAAIRSPRPGGVVEAVVSIDAAHELPLSFPAV
jgi:hypothetical protein